MEQLGLEAVQLYTDGCRHGCLQGVEGRKHVTSHVHRHMAIQKRRLEFDPGLGEGYAQDQTQPQSGGLWKAQITNDWLRNFCRSSLEKQFMAGAMNLRSIMGDYQGSSGQGETRKRDASLQYQP